MALEKSLSPVGTKRALLPELRYAGEGEVPPLILEGAG